MSKNENFIDVSCNAYALHSMLPLALNSRLLFKPLNPTIKRNSTLPIGKITTLYYLVVLRCTNDNSSPTQQFLLLKLTNFVTLSLFMCHSLLYKLKQKCVTF